MCKKILIAAVAVVVGLVVLKKSTLVQVWWNDLRQHAEAQITPETRVKQLRLEVDRIDDAIRQSNRVLARQEVEYNDQVQVVDNLRKLQAQRQDDMKALVAAIDKEQSQVELGDGRTVKAAEFARKLDSLTRAYETDKAQLKARDQVLAARKEALESARNRIQAMAQARDELRVQVEKLQAEIELVRLKQVQGKIAVDDTQIGRCNELLKKAQTAVAVEKREAELNAEVGIGVVPTEKVEEGKAREDARTRALKALEEPKAEKTEKVTTGK